MHIIATTHTQTVRLNGSKKMKLTSILILLFPFLSLGQENSKSESCNFNFHLTLKKGDSILLFSEGNENIDYLSQIEFDSIHIYINIDKSKENKVRIKAFDAIIKYDKDEIDEMQNHESFNKKYANKWIQPKHLKTSLSEWTFGPSEKRNEINQLYIYESPSTLSNKTKITSSQLIKIEFDKFQFLYSLKPIECKGRWIKLEIKTPDFLIIGWMPWYNLCHSTLALCHHLPEDGVKNE